MQVLQNPQKSRGIQALVSLYHEHRALGVSKIETSPEECKRCSGTVVAKITETNIFHETIITPVHLHAGR
jgi:hypothetical protein